MQEMFTSLEKLSLSPVSFRPYELTSWGAEKVHIPQLCTVKIENDLLL